MTRDQYIESLEKEIADLTYFMQRHQREAGKVDDNETKELHNEVANNIKHSIDSINALVQKLKGIP